MVKNEQLDPTKAVLSLAYADYAALFFPGFQPAQDVERRNALAREVAGRQVGGERRALFSQALGAFRLRFLPGSFGAPQHRMAPVGEVDAGKQVASNGLAVHG